jgi:hypothetical protein
MITKNFLTLTLLATALTLNAALPKEYILTTKQQSNSISTQIANNLYKRGIDEDKAMQISKEFTHENEELFAIMLHNLIHGSSLSQEALLKELTTMALQKKSIDFTSYSSLIGLVQRMQGHGLDKTTLSHLEEVATKNSLIKKVFA